MRLLATLLVINCCLRSSKALAPRWNIHGGQSNGRDAPKVPILSVLDNDNDDRMVMVSMRGGAAVDNGIVKRAKASLSRTLASTKRAFASIPRAIRPPKLSKLFQSKQDKQTEDLMKEMQSTLVLNVKVPNTTVLPEEVIQVAAKRSGMLGRPLQTDSVQEFARSLKRWYERKGYVLHSVTGATLHAETNTAEISVQEPYIHQVPIDITYCKEMVVDDDGSLLTFRQYKDKQTRRDTRGLADLKKEDLNTTFITTTGKTKPERIAKILQLNPQTPFRWQEKRWKAIVGSGIFSKVLQATPEPMPDGTVQLRIIATEAPPRNLEYGLSKSLYTGSWEGEMDFQHGNVLGGGESLGVSVKRGTKDAEPSVRVKFSDDNFGLEGGYDVEVFSDFIGESIDNDVTHGAQDYDLDAMLDRKGATVRLRNPFNPDTIRHSTASACLERTSTRAGHHESVGSATLGVGPFRTDLPLDARSHVLASLTTGTRIVDGGESSKFKILPFSTVSATTRQIFPLTQQGRRPLTLALQHTATTSTTYLPRYEAKAFGILSKIRGYEPSSDQRVASYVVGSTELRIPITLPTDKLNQDASVVIFGDWSLSQKDLQSSFVRMSSVGIGIRKGIQGIPIKYDLSYTRDGKIRAFFGLGRDFDV